MNRLNPKTVASILLCIILLTSILTQAQKFVPDENGYVSNPKFATFIHKHNYQLVGLFSKRDGPTLQAIVIKNGQELLIDQDGNETTKPAVKNDRRITTPGEYGIRDDSYGGYFNYVHPSNLDLEVIKGSKQGLLNKKTNAIIIPASYDEVRLSNFSFVMVREGEKWGILSKQGKVLINPKYDTVISLGSFLKGEQHTTGDAVIVGVNNKWGLISPHGLEVIPPQFDEITSSRSGFPLLFTRVGKKWGLINIEGKELVKPIYNKSDDFYRSGISRVSITENTRVKYGIIDTLGAYILKPVYDGVLILNDSTIITIIGRFRMAQVINTWTDKGVKISPGNYLLMDAFYKGFAGVMGANNKRGNIDSSGHEIVKPIYDYVEPVNSKYFVVSLNEKCGVIDFNNKVFIPLTYNGLIYQTDFGGFLGSIDGKKVMIDFYNNKYQLP